jgi:hypothetical protein
MEQGEIADRYALVMHRLNDKGHHGWSNIEII